MSSVVDRLRIALADRYRIERELGAGGMATVYLAHDLRHDREVAVKVMHPEVSAELATDRFLLEIRTSARLQHPHIVPVFDSGEADGQLFFVMPRIEGESLRARLDREGRLPVRDAVQIVSEVAGALEYAHEHGILHRDLKPENILLSHGHALLADFGIARATLQGGRERLTGTGTAIGTPAYMSPEQATGTGDTGPASDVYSLGVILFETLTGTVPFTGATFQAILVKRFTEAAPRCRTMRGDTPPACDVAIARALVLDANQRTATARAFADALVEVDMLHPAAPTSSTARPERSIAVLPFTNLSTDAENGYFADGLTEEIITTLAKVRALRVISRTTMMGYRTRTGSLRDIARELGVTHLLEGSVRKGGDRLRIAASLVDAERDASVWSERFDGSMDDVFDMQDRVASATVAALALALSPEEHARLVEHPIENAAAYDAYLRAREGLNAWTATGLQRALGHLEEAQRLAPDNLFVLRGLGRACWAAVNNSLTDDLTLLDDALRYAATIEGLSPGSPYAAELRGLVGAYRSDIDTSLRELGRAYEALPDEVDIAFWYGAFLIFAGRPEDALPITEDVRSREPAHPLLPLMESVGEWTTGRFDAALARLAGGPGTSPPAIWYLVQGLAGLAAGDHVHALQALDSAAAEPPDAMIGLSSFLAAAVRGDAKAAGEHLTPELAATLWRDFSYTEYAAEGFALLGDAAGARKWLARAADLGAGYYRGLWAHHAVWRPWLAHPDLAPIFAQIKANADRYAAIPLAPRARALAAQST
ncbi:protein kinase [Gemmatimonas sp.]|uniref:protein kinase domain-containing protein n=1 Tax=Gemmatimonas sp. TaxID=1962908 RepID=UPI00286E100C|nr:protein kinase [Gemmatimonas sp.]